MNDFLLQLAKTSKGPRVKTQFLLALPDIKEARSNGYSMAAIYELLKKQGRFHGSFSFFRQIVRTELEKENSVLQQHTPPENSPPRSPAPPALSIRQELEQFSANAPIRPAHGWQKRSPQEVL